MSNEQDDDAPVAEPPLTDEMALRIWNETAPYFGAAIGRTLARLRAPAQLRYDSQFHAEIGQFVAAQFWSSVQRGKLPSSTTGGLLICITTRTTSRLYKTRVREARRNVELTDQLNATCADDSIVDDAGDRRLELDVLGEVLEMFPELDRRILLSAHASENDYKKLASDTGLSLGALRTRKHRALKRLRREFNKRLLARRRR